MPFGLPARTQQGGYQHGLSRRAERNVRRAGALAEVFAQVQPEVGQIELVARNNERHFLCDQAFTLVGGECLRHIDHRLSRYRPQLVQPIPDIANGRFVWISL